MAIIAILFLSCRKDNNLLTSDVVIDGMVVEVDSYGGLKPSFSPLELKYVGIEYGDMLTIFVGDSIIVDVPYVDAFTEAGNMSCCLCNYNDTGTELNLSMVNGSFVRHVGGGVGDSLIVKLKEKEGYKQEYEMLKCVFTYDRSDYSSDEEFANFREITTTGMKPGALYRSSSPVSFNNNKERYVYSDSLCHNFDITTVINIANSDEEIVEYINSPKYNGAYMKKCLAAGNIIGLHSNIDYTDSVFHHKLARGLRWMIEKPAPYLIHCDEGKDRTGFYSILLEALCGASLDEIKEDYMLTFENLYHQEKGTLQYELTWYINGLRMLYQIAYPKTWEYVAFIEWGNISVENVDLVEAAENYIINAGLSVEEIKVLKEKIGTVY